MRKILNVLLILFFITNSLVSTAKSFRSLLEAKFIKPNVISKTVVLSSATISGNTTVCQNAAQPQITFTGSGGTAPYTFTYNIDGGALQTITTTSGNSVTVSAPTATTGVFNYNLISVHDAANPTLEQSSPEIATVIINPQPNANLNSSATSDTFNEFPVFKICSNQNTLIDFFNTSTTTASNLNYIINWGDGTSNFTSTSNWTTTSHNYSVGIWTLLYTIKGSNGCDITKTYKVFIGNNPAVGLGNPGNTDICISSSLTFPITGTENNPPGTTYTVTYNDGSPPTYLNHPPPSSVTHLFLKNSCGTTSNAGSTTYQNSFYASIVAINPCDQSSASVVPIRISTPPVSNFSLPKTIQCANNQICIINTSTGGDSATSTSCTTPKIIWTISPNSGYTLASGSLGNDFGSTNTNSWSSGSSSICPVFTIPGNYTITLKEGNHCNTDQISKTICIEPPLTPQFTLNTSSSCSPQAITATNTTDTTNSCSPPTYIWKVVHTPIYCGTSVIAIPNQTTTNASYNFTEPGTYSITLTSTNSCGTVISPPQIVTIKKPPTVAINTISNLCGPNSISPTATVSSCAPASSTLTYAWSFPGGTPSTSSLAVPGAISYATTGNYTVSLSVTNECGTTMATDKIFTINTVPVLTNSPLTETICSGTSTTLVNLTSNPAGATFNWTATATSGITGFTPFGTNTIPVQTILNSNVSPGTVTYAITPLLNGCPGSVTNYVITVNPAPAITVQPISSVVCLGGNPTLLSFSISGSVGLPTYQWYSNSTNTNSGGTLLTGETNPTYNPPASTVGTLFYYCIITLPSGGCSSLKTNATAVTIQPNISITTQPTPTQNLCVGATISSPLNATTTGGAGTVSYQWFSNLTNTNTGGTSISGATNANYTPPVFTSSGTYYYYVVASPNGNSCTPITSNVAEIVVANTPIISTQPLTSQSLCQGSAPSNLTIVASGGVGAIYSYQWYSSVSNSNSGGAPIIGATTATFTPPTTSEGTVYYYATVSQTAIGCNTKSNVAQVIINLSPAIATQPQSSTVCLGQTPTLLNVSYSNGTGTPQYQWYSNTVNSMIGSSLISGATNATYIPQNTSVGTTYYYCTITLPTGGCSSLTSNIATVTINPYPVISNKNATICSGNPFTIDPVTSGAEIVPTGTTYTWTTPIITPAGVITGALAETTPQTSISQTLFNTSTSPATVTYTVTPKSGTCTGATFTVSVVVNPGISPNLVSNSSSCFGINNGSFQTNITGGIPFSTGASYQISWTGPNGYSSNAANISNLAPGNYTLSIIDNGGCPFTNSYTITEPDEIIITTVLKKDISCFNAADGEIKITLSGGTLNYIINWTKNGAAFATTEDLSNLSPGTYIVTVSDANNCAPTTASFTIIEPAILDAYSTNQTNVLCFGDATGAISINATGGRLPYSFAWTGPNGFTSSNQNITSVYAGNFSLIVTDNSGCTKNLSFQITQNPEILITATTTPIICYGDNMATIKITVSGGTAPYQIQWSNLAIGTYQDNLGPGDYIVTITDALNCIKTKTINIPDVPIFSVNPVVKNVSCFGNKNGSININLVGGIAPVNLVWSDGSTAGTVRNNLGPGTYTATITDSKPCTITRTFVIVEPQPLSLSANVTNAFDCNNTNSGNIELLVAGGSPPYTYNWSNGATTKDLINITSGNYLVTVTDANSCTKQAQFSVNRPAPLNANVVTNTVFDCETKFVSQRFLAQVSGGVPPYNLIWSSGTISGTNGEIMNTNQNGTVVLNVTDAIGCKTNYSLNVATPILGDPSFTTSSYSYLTFGTYSINDPIQFTNTATADFISVNWDFGDGSFSTELNPTHIYINPKDYVVTQTVTYPFGCVYIQKTTLTIEKGYVLVVPNAFTPNNDTVNDTFRPVTKGLKNVRLDVYDTWGSMIYSETGDILRGWDGKIKGNNAENGNYYCKVRGETFYGTIVNENHPFVLIK